MIPFFVAPARMTCRSGSGLISVPAGYQKRFLLLLAALVLSAPALAIDPPDGLSGTDVSSSGNLAIQWQWNAVNGAIQYELTVDGKVVGLTPNTSYTSTGLWLGDHSLTVKAIDKDWRYSTQSSTTKIYLTGAGSSAPQQSSTASAGNSTLDPPANVRGTEIGTKTVKWEWNAVSGAAQYELTIDGSASVLENGTSYTSHNLWPGDHSLTVKAIDGQGRYSGSSATAKIVVRSRYDGSATNTSHTVGSAHSSNVGSNVGSNEGSNQTSSQTSTASTTSSSSSPGVASQPQNPRGTEVGQSMVKWEWDWVAGAARYEVTVDGQVAGLTTDTHYYSENLWAGDHSMTVRAVSSGNQMSERSATAKLVVRSNYDSSVTNASYQVGSDEPSSVVTASAPPPSQEINASQPVDNPDDTGMIDPASWAYNEVYQKDGYELVFSDEFNGATLNRNRWNTQLRWDGEHNGERYEYRVINGENQMYVSIYSPDNNHLNQIVPQHNPFELNGSRLAIRAVKNPLKTNNGNRDHGSVSEIASQQEFLSGAITTYDKFYRRYGYFEARIKIPSHVGTFPAFWLHHQRRLNENTQRTEIDILENLGHAPWYIYNTFHYYTDVSEYNGGNPHFVKPSPDGQIYTGTDYSQNYHTYAVKWEPGHITWYIDGEKVSEVWNSNADFEDLYVLINMAVGGEWTNYPANSGGLGRSESQYFPNGDDLANWQNPALEIDYVRVYAPK